MLERGGREANSLSSLVRAACIAYSPTAPLLANFHVMIGERGVHVTLPPSAAAACAALRRVLAARQRRAEGAAVAAPVGGASRVLGAGAGEPSGARVALGRRAGLACARGTIRVVGGGARVAQASGPALVARAPAGGRARAVAAAVRAG